MQCPLRSSDTLFFYKNFLVRTLRLRFDQKFTKMYGMKEKHPQAQPNFTAFSVPGKMLGSNRGIYEIVL